MGKKQLQFQSKTTVRNKRAFPLKGKVGIPSLCPTVTYVLVLFYMFILIKQKKGVGECVPRLLFPCAMYLLNLSFIGLVYPLMDGLCTEIKT